ncbi:hypothetical protein A7K93_10690 [Candidatus Methylacidiphilum fumarolicum]|uniref:Uncharacterized protein n=2 Tax=Candidatus Methylacidiphilum fumarolicum TaxID=591154 RepID=I0JZS3_METFB|nr:hypothetical protein [Candidatus Methylacidiphilum fumarolicum]CCG92742.1 hypothetical protein MFUM_760008 [Methylacidiphilum fumariolicum SolV]TFE68000.1 hypothetical protein A7K73_08165 [Candidatus Methylacidiphilum fumarolicum]TFE71525.1 hypothetical protein A7K93_10690 [Candidatus Methylacidiphilum fumarolicum]TFE73432.1 hypothetical protein A7K72_06680 [Candidatus Methylacidiphilum fumarolicum]TFE77788.1 hypothetical protein A7D33_03055 [Candidatus Methylacidiphilum fumarolicum]
MSDRRRLEQTLWAAAATDLLEARAAESACLLEVGKTRLFALPDATDVRLEGEIETLECYLDRLSIDQGEERTVEAKIGETIGTARSNRCFAFPLSPLACTPQVLGSRGSDHPKQV